MSAIPYKIPHEGHTLAVVRGYQGQELVIRQLVHLCWLAAYTILWNGEMYSDNEVQRCKQVIKRFIINANELHEGANEFIQRLLLARIYLERDDRLRRMRLDRWMEMSGPNGFSATEVMFERVQVKRISTPLYRHSLKGFADAVFEFGTDPSNAQFHYWREYFLERKQQRMLNLFLAFAGNVWRGEGSLFVVR